MKLREKIHVSVNVTVTEIELLILRDFQAITKTRKMSQIIARCYSVSRSHIRRTHCGNYYLTSVVLTLLTGQHEAYHSVL